MLSEGTKEAIFDWFQDREVTNEAKFNIYFNRTLNRDLPQYYQLLRLEPGFDESGVSQYDWMVQNFEDITREHNGFNTNTGNHELAEIIRKGIGSVTKTEGADTDTAHRISNDKSTDASTDREDGIDKTVYSGGKSVSDTEQNSGKTEYKGSHITSEAGNGSDNLSYKGNKITSGTEDTREQTVYSGTKSTTENNTGSDVLTYTGKTEKSHSGKQDESITYNGEEHNDRHRYPDLVTSTSGSDKKDSSSTVKTGAKAAPQNISYNSDVEGGKLPTFSWRSLTSQGQQDTSESDSSSSTEKQTETGTEDIEDKKSFVDRKDNKSGTDSSTDSESFVGRSDNRTTSDEKTIDETYKGRNDQKDGGTTQATVESFSGREDDRTTETSKTTVEGYQDRSDNTEGNKTNVSIENYQDRSDTKTTTSQNEHADVSESSSDGAEVQTHSKGTTITVTPTGDDDKSNRTGSDTSVGTEGTNDHEVHTGRNGYPAEILAKAYDFIKSSSAWIWLEDRLEVCFLQIL